MIVKRIEHDLEAIVVGERIVAAHLAPDDAVAIRVEAGRADVDRLVVEQHADLGPLGDRLARPAAPAESDR